MEDVFKRIGNDLTLSQKIEKRMEKAIREKRLPVGSKLPSERELCELFGVSRTAIREALRRLSARGLVQISKGSGMSVTSLEMDDAIGALNLYFDLHFDKKLAREIIEARRLMEPEVARLAALQRTDADLEQIYSILENYRKLAPDQVEQEAKLDNEFHLAIAKASHNPVIQIALEPVYALLPRIINLGYHNVEVNKQQRYITHLAIFEAIRKRQDEKAAKAMQEHLNLSAGKFL